MVPVGSAAPDDASVRGLTHPDAYPISFVTQKRLFTRRSRATPSITAAFVKYLTGPRATASFRACGMLLLRDAWPEPPSSARPGARARLEPTPEPELPPEPELAPEP